MRYHVKDGLMDAELVSSSGRTYKVLLDTAWTEEQIEEARKRVYSSACLSYYNYEKFRDDREEYEVLEDFEQSYDTDSGEKTSDTDTETDQDRLEEVKEPPRKKTAVQMRL